ncbi:uncharacterized protein [Gossypium hirsutum]|uniref:Uncharacterized protein n=1 Tax=Gossypium hirsutum TaxID=3635 RepID=A0ABM2Z3P0_GOSHI|nr:uncharacterized protein LOC121209811 [Gossypium hirsutum]
MEKKSNESFRQYAQRWREVAMQVQPPLLENETTMLFINTLKAPFINHMLGNATKSFTDIVMSGEMIENAIRSGKIEAGESTRRDEEHEIETCNEFRALVQGLMDNKEIEFFEFAEEKHVCASEEGLIKKVCKVNHLVVIISRPRTNEAGAKTMPKVVIQKLTAFLYKDNKMVPWSYNCNVILPREGRLASTPDTKVEPVKEKSLMSKRWEERTKPLVNEPVTADGAKGFLKFLKHSEYSVVEQLHKQPAPTSILVLLQNLEAHCNALMKVLNETYVAEDISVNKLDQLVNNISADNFISFSDDEIPPGGMGSTKALHITTRCKGYTLLGVLIDNGSALNVLPLSTLSRLPIDSSYMKTCQNIVRAFDGTKRKVIGAVKSSLHQKLKLMTKGRLITVNAEEDIIASVASDTPYIESDDEAIECAFRSLEFVNATFIIEGGKILMPELSEATRMSLQLMVGKGAFSGRGLRKYLYGRVKVPVLVGKRDRFGLGHRPDAKQKKEELVKKQERRRARLSGAEVK